MPEPTALAVRDDLRRSHEQAWRHVAAPGSWWNGAERVAIARVALAALDDPDPLPPWVAPTAAGRRPAGSDGLPEAAVDAAYRIARHASTLTDGWYRSILERGIGALAYVELVGVVIAVAAVDGFARAAGVDRPPLPFPESGEADHRHPPLAEAELNWVPVAAPADQKAAVVQALSAVPAEWENLAQLHAAQYIPVHEMGDMGWTRGTLDRPQMELVAARLSAARQCFY
ncbi:MAG: alkylhydroperoxidase-related (seleno)protein [Acidimicrobiia bacterium]